MYKLYNMRNLLLHFQSLDKKSFNKFLTTKLHVIYIIMIVNTVNSYLIVVSSQSHDYSIFNYFLMKSKQSKFNISG
jgi:hypothetical protein